MLKSTSNALLAPQPASAVTFVCERKMVNYAKNLLSATYYLFLDIINYA